MEIPASGVYLPTLFGSGEAAFDRVRQILLGASLIGVSAAFDSHNTLGYLFFGALIFFLLNIISYYAKKLPYDHLKEAVVQLFVLMAFVVTFFLVAIISSVGQGLLASNGSVNWKTVIKLLFVFLMAVVFFIIIPRFFPRIKLRG
jgi:hypothetical protein